MQNHEAVGSRLYSIRDRFEQLGIDWVIFAGAAALCYGSNRQVTDIDILVRCEELQKAEAVLVGVNLEGFDVVCGFDIETDGGTYPYFLDEDMVNRRRVKELFGVRVPVISVEDNIVLKAILQRGKALGKFDIEDIKAMLETEKIDWRYLKKRIFACNAEKRVRPLLQSLPNVPVWCDDS